MCLKVVQGIKIMWPAYFRYCRKIHPDLILYK